MTLHALSRHSADDVLDVPADQFVLSGRSLNPDWRLEQTSRFGDDVWDLRPALFQRHLKARVLDFKSIPVTYRQTVKHLCLAMLAGVLPPGESRQNPSSVRRLFVEIKRFAVWLDGRPAAKSRRLRDLTHADLADYARYLGTVLRSTASREVAEVGVRLFWRYRTALSDDHLIVDPLEADGWGRSSRRRLGENTTPRIPEEVMGPLLAWSMRFIDDFAADILAAGARWLEDQPRRGRSRIARNQAGPRLRALLDDHIAAGRPLPGRDGCVNYAQLAKEVGCSPTTVRLFGNQSAIDAVAAAVGVADYTHIGTPITGRLDGQAWTTHIGPDSGDPYGAASLALRLQTACYIAIAYLSGMRDSEIKHLRRGSVRAHRNSAGDTYRWTITSQPFKGETDPAGTQATWVIGAAAARAVRVLEQLQPAHVDAVQVPAPPGTGSQAGRPQRRPHQRAAQQLRQLGQQLLRPARPLRHDPAGRRRHLEAVDQARSGARWPGTSRASPPAPSPARSSIAI
ncbi:hypothetical protein AB0B66_21140 [Catellatospora sp. NPDC049111]|uniref:hypothetical protein n=1 Tax=Catellatospora sp. NPDC049111 TaxID=3155271 RepID=UPI0034118312